MRAAILGLGIFLLLPQGRAAEQIGPPFHDMLPTLNAMRAARGLAPFRLDPQLQAAARACALYRARHQIRGHTNNDFAFLPVGARAAAAGCATWTSSDSFGGCCKFERWTYAGAATVRGSDGLDYHHLFVR